MRDYAGQGDFFLCRVGGAMSSGLFADLPVQAVPGRAGGGRPRLRPAERGQVELRAVMDDLVPADHRVRLVWRFVEGLDLSALLAEIKALEGRPGHLAADPRIVVALWLLATIEGVGSARALARRCEESLPFQWLRGGAGMNHKTLSDFRIGQGAVLEGLLVDSCAALLVSGVAGLERVAQDAEARVMKMADGGFRPACNVQLAADAKSGAAAGVAVDNIGSDMGRMKPMSEALEAACGRRPAGVESGRG